MNQRILNIIQIAGAILAFGGALIKLLEPGIPGTYIFTAGAVILLVVQFINVLKTKNADMRIKRLNRILLLATALLGVAAYMMFANPVSESWVVMVLLYAVLSVFLTFRAN